MSWGDIFEACGDAVDLTLVLETRRGRWIALAVVVVVLLLVLWL